MPPLWRAYHIDTGPLRYAEYSIFQNRFADRQGELLDRFRGGGVKFIGRNEDEFELAYLRHFTNIRAPFSIAGVLPVDIGTYSRDEYRVRFQTSNKRTVSLRMNALWGGRFDGDWLSLDTGFVWRPSKHYELNAGYKFEEFDLTNGSVAIHVADIETKVNFDARTQLSAQLQYDNISEGLSFSGRYSWEPDPQTEVLIALTPGARIEAGPVPGQLWTKRDQALLFAWGAPLGCSANWLGAWLMGKIDKLYPDEVIYGRN